MANSNSAKNYSKLWFWSKALMKLSLHRLRRSKKSMSVAEQPQDYFRKMFNRFDADGDGRISREELHSFFAWAGDRISTEEASVLLQEIETDEDGLIEYEEFVRLVRGGEMFEEDVRRAFEMFEEEEEGKGFITPIGLKRVLGRIGERRTEEECAAMIKVYDVDGNGVLDYLEFRRMMS